MLDLKSKFAVVLGAVLLSGLTACTRAEEKPTQINIAIPNAAMLRKVTGQENTRIGMISLVATSGTKSVRNYWNFEEQCERVNCDPDVNPPATPNAMVLDVDQGDNTFQLLIVTENSSNQREFWYADLTKKIAAATDTVNLQAVKVGNSTVEAKVAGRFLTTASPAAGPTGTMRILFHPPGGKPSIDLMTTDIVNGYFSAMFMDGVYFSYVMQSTGFVVFDHKTLADFNAMTATPSNAIRKLNFGDYYRDSGNGCKKEPAFPLYFGFFGTVPLDAHVCEVGNVERAYAAPGCSTLASWPVGTGGVGTCASGPKLEIQKELMSNGGSDLSGIRGAFKTRLMQGHYDYLERQIAGANHVLDWNLQDGVASVLGGFDVFSSPQDLNQFYGIGGFDCNKLKATVGDPIATVSAGTTSHTISSADNSMNYAVCAFTGNGPSKTYVGEGIPTRGMSNGSWGPFYRFSVVPGAPAFTSGGTFSVVNVFLQNQTGTSTPVTGVALPVSISTYNSNVSFSASPNGDAPSGTLVVSVPPGSSQFSFYTKATNPNWENIGVSAENAERTEKELFFISATSASATQMSFDYQSPAMGLLVTDQCYPMTVRLKDGLGQPAIVSSNVELAISTTAGTTGVSGGVYVSPSCTSGTPLSSITVLANTPSYSFYYKPTLTGVSSTNLTVVSAPTGATTGITGASAMAQLGDAVLYSNGVRPFAGDLKYTAGFCTGFELFPQNIVGARIHPASPLQFSVSGGADAELASSCDGPWSSMVTGSISGIAPANIFFKSTPSGATTVLLSTTIGVTAGTANFTVRP